MPVQNGKSISSQTPGMREFGSSVISVIIPHCVMTYLDAIHSDSGCDHVQFGVETFGSIVEWISICLAGLYHMLKFLLTLLREHSSLDNSGAFEKPHYNGRGPASVSGRRW